MPEKPEKKNKPETKKEKSKYGLSKETLERILEAKTSKENFHQRGEKESILSEEELKNPIIKTKKSDSEEVIFSPQQKRVFLERELSESSSGTISEKNRSGNSFEYVSKNPEGENQNGEKKYISYENSPNTKFESAKKISESWSNPLGREAGFVSSENSQNKNSQQYETYINPKKFSEDEMKERSKKGDSPEFVMRETKMHYDH